MASLRWWIVAWPGLCATLTGVGFGRFAYTALIPFLVGTGQVTGAEAGYLGAANLAGYLVGVLLAAFLALRLGTTPCIRGSFILTALGLALCIIPGGFWWLFPWRALCGITGGVLMVLGPSFVLAQTVPGERGRVGGVIFTGVGLGAVLGTLVAGPLASLGTSYAWAGLTLGVCMVAVWSWHHWHGHMPIVTRIIPERNRFPLTLPLIFGALAFGMDGPGIIPHTIFSVDFIARELGRGTVAGNFNWLVFGLGAAVGPFLAGTLGDRIGLARALVLVFAVKAVAVALPWQFTAAPVLALSAAVVGALTPAIPTVLAARVAELVAPHDQARAWGFATLAFSLAQAIGAYGFSFAYAEIGHYQPLFLAGGIFEAIAVLCALAALRARAPI